MPFLSSLLTTPLLSDASENAGIDVGLIQSTTLALHTSTGGTRRSSTSRRRCRRRDRKTVKNIVLRASFTLPLDLFARRLIFVEVEEAESAIRKRYVTKGRNTSMTYEVSRTNRTTATTTISSQQKVDQSDWHGGPNKALIFPRRPTQVGDATSGVGNGSGRIRCQRLQRHNEIEARSSIETALRRTKTTQSFLSLSFFHSSDSKVPDGHIFLETFSPVYRHAQDFLIAIAEVGEF